MTTSRVTRRQLSAQAQRQATSDAKTSILFIRHAESITNITRQPSCRLIDLGLTPLGYLQARETANFIARLDIKRIYSSPLLRARQTAGILAHACGLRVAVVEDFREVDVGDLEHIRSTESAWTRHDQVVAAWRQGQCRISFPNGENYHMLLTRFRHGLQMVCADTGSGKGIVVGHAGSLNYTLHHICPKTGINPRARVPMANASITELRKDSGGKCTFTLRSWANVAHLAHLADKDAAIE